MIKIYLIINLNLKMKDPKTKNEIFKYKFLKERNFSKRKLSEASSKSSLKWQESIDALKSKCNKNMKKWERKMLNLYDLSKNNLSQKENI